MGTPSHFFVCEQLGKTLPLSLGEACLIRSGPPWYFLRPYYIIYQENDYLVILTAPLPLRPLHTYTHSEEGLCRMCTPWGRSCGGHLRILPGTLCRRERRQLESPWQTLPPSLLGGSAQVLEELLIAPILSCQLHRASMGQTVTFFLLWVAAFSAWPELPFSAVREDHGMKSHEFKNYIKLT